MCNVVMCAHLRAHSLINLIKMRRSLIVRRVRRRFTECFMADMLVRGFFAITQCAFPGSAHLSNSTFMSGDDRRVRWQNANAQEIAKNTPHDFLSSRNNCRERFFLYSYFEMSS